jgi:AcrR family transcriptional regulator
MRSTRDRIVTATAELFRRQGYNGTGLKQVTQAAGAPVGSVYHFFPGGKDELAETVILTSGRVYQELTPPPPTWWQRGSRRRRPASWR